MLSFLKKSSIETYFGVAVLKLRPVQNKPVFTLQLRGLSVLNIILLIEVKCFFIILLLQKWV